MTIFNFVILPKQRSQQNTIICLFTHLLKNLESFCSYLTQSFETIRGQTKLIVAKQFRTENKFFGILQYFLDLANYDRIQLRRYLNSEKNKNQDDLFDIYNSAKQIARVANFRSIADQLEETTTRDYLILRVE